MEKRYQVFISSTFIDLQEARGKVFQTLMEMDCIPAGMELFPAMDEEQMQFIKRIIDDCDYYILILGGRYGSVSAEGISYTEMEYDYAIKKGLKVLAFIHENPDDLPVKYTDRDPTLKKKLDEFRQKVCNGRLARKWSNIMELQGLVALSLNRTIKTSPAIGWVRADKVSNEDAIRQQNDLLKERDSLNAELEKYKSEKKIPQDLSIAGLDEEIIVTINYSQKAIYLENHTNEVSVTWRILFSLIAPDLQKYPSDKLVNKKMGQALLDHNRLEKNYIDIGVNKEIFKTIRIQLTVLNLITTHYSQFEKDLLWSLTALGEQIMYHERTVRPNN